MGLDIIETFMAVEAEFGISVPDAEAGRMRTVGALFDYVRAHSPARSASETGPGSPYAGPLWDRFVDVVQWHAGVERREVRPEAYWVEDLGMD